MLNIDVIGLRIQSPISFNKRLSMLSYPLLDLFGRTTINVFISDDVHGAGKTLLFTFGILLR